MARKLEELPVYSQAMDFWAAVRAILDRPRVRRFRKLHEQVDEANDSITSNMVEGFEQGTDRSFAGFLTYSKGSVAEVVVRLRQLHAKRAMTADELAELVSRGEQLQRALGGFIKYLLECNFKDRGRHRAAERRTHTPNCIQNDDRDRDDTDRDRDKDRD